MCRLRVAFFYTIIQDELDLGYIKLLTNMPPLEVIVRFCRGTQTKYLGFYNNKTQNICDIGWVGFSVGFFIFLVIGPQLRYKSS